MLWLIRSPERSINWGLRYESAGAAARRPRLLAHSNIKMTKCYRMEILGNAAEMASRAPIPDNLERATGRLRRPIMLAMP